MHKLDLNIVRLKLLLAEVNAKRETLTATRRQYEDQINRLVDITIHEDSGVDRTLGMILDVDTRLQEVARQQHYLELVGDKARRELDSLQLTKLIEETRAQLALLRQRQREEDTNARVDEEGVDHVAQEIRRLEEIITVASGVAVKSISSR